jgi:hypothetical protein
MRKITTTMTTATKMTTMTMLMIPTVAAMASEKKHETLLGK